ncbi:MAG: DUF1524 domain-containing protein [Acutalibacteraceae bacterium]
MRTRNYILNRLENFQNKAPIAIENYTIEHIMPQNTHLSEQWQKRIGYTLAGNSKQVPSYNWQSDTNCI